MVKNVILSGEENTLFHVQDGIARITLNRPQKLNALAIDQFNAISEHLNNWAADESVKFVVIKGAGDKAFCAGGDVRSVWDNRQAGDDETSHELFRREYRMNRLLHHYQKPIISLLDGITMGGGAGISMPGLYRIATPKTLFAMPETSLGFFPDVGATWFLGHCPGQVGLYLALTGARIKADDMRFCGLASHVLASDAIGELLAELPVWAASNNPEQALAKGLAALELAPQMAPLMVHLPAIERVFGQPDIASIFSALQSELENPLHAAWAKDTLAQLQAASPTSLAVTLIQLREGKGLGFDEVMRREYDLACGFLRNADFYEGIRSILVDKDRNPNWSVLDQQKVRDHFRRVEKLEF